MKAIFNHNTLASMLIALLVVGGFACKSKKKVTDVSDNTDKTETTTTPAETTNREKEETTKTSKPEVDLKTRTSNKLSDYFAAIAGAPSVSSANRSIQEALNLFESPETLVLIVINESNGKKDYDRPTSIQEYLNYLKDQKKNNNGIGEFKMNNAGEITELELVKK